MFFRLNVRSKLAGKTRIPSVWLNVLSFGQATGFFELGENLAAKRHLMCRETSSSRTILCRETSNSVIFSRNCESRPKFGRTPVSYRRLRQISGDIREIPSKRQGRVRRLPGKFRQLSGNAQKLSRSSWILPKPPSLTSEDFPVIEQNFREPPK